MIWPFRRKPASPPPEAPKQTEDWQAGDLAQCRVAGHSWAYSCTCGPRHGEIRRVVKVRAGTGTDGTPAVGLEFANHIDHAFDEQCFTKIRPATDEFVESITRKRKVDA